MGRAPAACKKPDGVGEMNGRFRILSVLLGCAAGVTLFQSAIELAVNALQVFTATWWIAGELSGAVYPLAIGVRDLCFGGVLLVLHRFASDLEKGGPLFSPNQPPRFLLAGLLSAWCFVLGFLIELSSISFSGLNGFFSYLIHGGRLDYVQLLPTVSFLVLWRVFDASCRR